jgi:hypothetical protein
VIYRTAGGKGMNIKLIFQAIIFGLGLFCLAWVCVIQGGLALINTAQSPFYITGIIWGLFGFFVAFYAIVIGYVSIRLAFQIIYELKIR